MRREPEKTYDAILVDIDHSPRHVLADGHDDFYTAQGVRRLAKHLKPGGVFALWSDDPPDEQYSDLLDLDFPENAAHVVAFDNPLTGGQSANTVYVAKLG